MSSEIIISESVQLGVVQASSPADVIKRASEMSDVLKDIIEKKKLYSMINGKKYVRVEGWSTMGAMIGVLPHEVWSKKIENGYEAFVELIRMTDAMVIGGASAICTREEKNWQNRDEFALKSMSATRATGKAFRLGFAWIMNLAGYESTPAEEMIDAEIVEPKDKPRPKLIRPLAPAELKEQMMRKVEKYAVEQKPVTEADSKKLIANLSQLTQGDDILRQSLTHFLVVKESTKSMTGNEIHALNDWINAKPDSGGAFVIDGMAAKEYRRIVDEVFVEGFAAAEVIGK